MLLPPKNETCTPHPIVRIPLWFAKSAPLVCLLLVTFTLQPPSRVWAATGSQAAVANENRAVTLPPTPAGRQFAEWLRVFNGGDTNATRSFISKHFAEPALKRIPTEARVNMDTVLYNTTRGLVPYHLDWSTDPEITVSARANLTEESVRIHLEVGSDPLHQITKFSFTLTGHPADTTSLENLSESQMLQRLEMYLKKLVAADMFSGSVLVAKNGNPIFQNAYGYANIDAKIPNQLNTKFNLASMNKMFTGVAIAQLVAQGKLSFDDTMGKYLPDYPNKEAAREVTIHQLLTHTSGMGDYFNSRFERNLKSVRDYFPLFANERLSFKPGDRYRYSNAGYIVLGAIIEEVSGQSYFDYVREHIYKSAGMSDTDSYEIDRDTPSRAAGYTNVGPKGLELLSRKDDLPLLPVKGGPAGGGFSTVQDLLKFAEALRTHKLLNPKFTELVLAGKVERDDEMDGKYAYGFAEDRVNGKRIVGYAGAYPGVNGEFDVYPDLGYTVVVLSNYDPPSAQRVAYQLREMSTHLAAH